MTYKNLIFNNTNQFKNHQRGAAKSEIQMQKQKKNRPKKETHLLQLAEVRRFPGQSLISVPALWFWYHCAGNENETLTLR